MHDAALRRTIRIGAGLTVALAVAVGGLAAYVYLLREPPQPQASGPAVTTVTVTASGCEPAELSVEAGRVTFEIRNSSQRVLEWEILDGVMVVDERENIAPGLSQRLTTRLEPGNFAITCGLLSNPRGRLVVTPSSAPDTGSRAPAPVALIGPAAEYKVQLVLASDALAKALKDVAVQVATGDPGAAKALADAHVAYARIRPVVKLVFVDLDTAMDARAEDFAAGSADPNFTGFRRLAAGLAAGGPSPALASTAAKLAEDAAALRERLGAVSIPPARIVTGAALMLADAAGQLRSAARPAPPLVAGYLDAAGSINTLLQPLARKAAPDLAQRLDTHLATARSAHNAALADTLQALSDDFIALREALGLG